MEVESIDDMDIKKKNRFHCQRCSKAFLKQFDLIQHERTHTGERPFSCEVCDKKFNQKSNMKKHLRTLHRVWPEALRTLPPLRPISASEDLQDSINMYYCPFCTLGVPTYSEFKKHLVDSHVSEKVYKCLNQDCLETFHDVAKFVEHVKKHQRKSIENCSEPLRNYNMVFKCDVCSLVFKRYEALQWHLSVESHDHVCPKCNATYLAERYLRRHLATHSKPIICLVCKKVLKYGQTLKNHMFLHEPMNGFPCDICDKRFVNYYRLNRHFAVHSDKPLVCTYKLKYGCEKRFSRKDKLLTHIRTHTNSDVGATGYKESKPIEITYEVLPIDS